MKSYRNSDLLILDDIPDHVSNILEAGHILACALGNLDDDGSLRLLSGLQNCLCPLKVVEVESTDRIVTGISGLDHFFCRN